MKKFRHILPILLLILYLGVYEGKVALLRGGHSVPVQIYSHDASLYPPEARQALEEGIPIRNQRHLDALLETYLS
ncbi:MAG: hypothetical protein IJD63_01825 [Oscillospiraceae bacterium]|nr:hypothetical protein [Oscillospiraceae bacterium]